MKLEKKFVYEYFTVWIKKIPLTVYEIPEHAYKMKNNSTKFRNQSSINKNFQIIPIFNFSIYIYWT